MAYTLFINDNNPPGARGMARYFRHSLDGLLPRFGREAVVFSHVVRNYAPAKHIRPVRFKGSEQFRLHDRQCALAVRRTRPKVIYSAWFNTLRTAALQVIVVYDLIYELFPQYHAWRQVPLRNLGLERQRSLERADKVLVISQSTANDIMAIYPQVEAAKIIVTPLGVEPFFFETTPPAPDAGGKPYLLYVGARGGHKNFLRLLTAYGRSGLAPEFDFRVISDKPFDAVERERLQRYHLETSVQRLPAASELELRQNYAGAAAFICPSEYEGFGLPLLEAMASGTLVVTSNVSAMPEVGGEVALYFDPHDEASIAEGLRQATGLSSEERRWRVARGVARVRTFTWERCQQQTITALETLLG